jgi:D-Tyr-tRNAtyr deacylase
MRIVIQRVKEASVRVDSTIVGQINRVNYQKLPSE